MYELRISYVGVVLDRHMYAMQDQYCVCLCARIETAKIKYYKEYQHLAWNYERIYVGDTQI